MFERFSSGYYLGRLYVEPTEAETPAMCRRQHEQVNEQLYDEDGSPPPVMKLDTHHFRVTGEAGVPRDTLAVPRALLADTRVRNPPALTTVLLAKAGRARQLLELAGGEGETDDRRGFRPGGPAI